MSNRKGFTLLELVIVIIVLGVLAAVALPQYAGFVERAKAAEAVAAIGAVKTAELAYAAAQASGNYKTSASAASILNDLGVTLPTNLWSFGVSATGNSNFVVTATRATGPAAGTLINFTFNNNGTSTWTGNHPGKPQ